MTFIRKLTALLGRRANEPPAIRLEDFSEFPPEDGLPYLDRKAIDDAALTPDQRAWRRDGVLILRNFLSDEVTAPYIEARAALGRAEGWPHGTSYMYEPTMRDLALHPALMAKMRELIGEEMMLHLCLTHWVTTEREWHQDDYLNPDFVRCWYCAAWIALGDVGPDCGPFEYIPGSHRWPLMRGEKVRALLAPHERERWWEIIAGRFTSPAIQYEISQRAAPVKSFLAKRGDVLIWHGRLMHRGSMAKIPGMERRALIAHYSGIEHRADILAETRQRDRNGQTYVMFGAAESGRIEGWVDSIAGTVVTGWIRDQHDRAAKLAIEAVLPDGEVLARGVADIHHPALASTDPTNREHGFTLALPRELAEDERAALVVRAAEGGGQVSCLPPYQGYVDARTSRRVAGWVRNRYAVRERPVLQVVLETPAGTEVLAEGEAGQFHAWLAESEVGDGYNGFDVSYSRRLSDAEREAVSVRIKATGSAVELSPRLLTMERDEEQDKRLNP